MDVGQQGGVVCRYGRGVIDHRGDRQQVIEECPLGGLPRGVIVEFDAVSPRSSHHARHRRARQRIVAPLPRQTFLSRDQNIDSDYQVLRSRVSLAMTVEVLKPRHVVIVVDAAHQDSRDWGRRRCTPRPRSARDTSFGASRRRIKRCAERVMSAVCRSVCLLLGDGHASASSHVAEVCLALGHYHGP